MSWDRYAAIDIRCENQSQISASHPVSWLGDQTQSGQTSTALARGCSSQTVHVFPASATSSRVYPPPGWCVDRLPTKTQSTRRRQAMYRCLREAHVGPQGERAE